MGDKILRPLAISLFRIVGRQASSFSLWAPRARRGCLVVLMSTEMSLKFKPPTTRESLCLSCYNLRRLHILEIDPHPFPDAPRFNEL